VTGQGLYIHPCSAQSSCGVGPSTLSHSQTSEIQSGREVALPCISFYGLGPTRLDGLFSDAPAPTLTTESLPPAPTRVSSVRLK
jgi:hypothetical protein